MKFRAKHFVCSVALVALTVAGISAAWALAKPGGGYTIWYYSDATHTTVVGNLTLSCPTGELIMTGQSSAYPGPKVIANCGTTPMPPGPYYQW
jgi:hypothetical protein